MLKPRYYQEEAVYAAVGRWLEGDQGTIIELATGTGKSLVAAMLAEWAIEAGVKVLIVTHVGELVDQNAKELRDTGTEASIGIYCAGRRRRELDRDITVATHQSLVNAKEEDLPEWGLVIIDECHLVPRGGDTNYRKILRRVRERNPDARLAGLTATPYRLNEGRLEETQSDLFQSVAYKYDIMRGINDGYLCPLTCEVSEDIEVDTTNVARGIDGDFREGDLAVEAEKVTAEAVRDVIHRGKNRRKWLIFACGVQHAHNVSSALNELSTVDGRCENPSAVITGETRLEERCDLLDKYKTGDLRALVNVGVLTTGFNVPDIDLIVFLRPTCSASLYVQMMGRGSRIASGKEDCLVLDYAGNVQRLGPVDLAQETTKAIDGGTPNDYVDAKEEDGEKIESEPGPGRGQPMHDTRADIGAAALSSQTKPDTRNVLGRWSARRHIGKHSGKPSLKVMIVAGTETVNEFIPFEHTGVARQRAISWWVEHGGGLPAPKTVDEAVDRFDELHQPERVTIEYEGKYARIRERELKKGA